MKPSILALILSVVINLVGMYVNYKSFEETKYLKLAYKMYGGECLIEFGFGLRVLHKYSMRKDQPSTATLHFAPITLFVSVFLLYLIFYFPLRFII